MEAVYREGDLTRKVPVAKGPVRVCIGRLNALIENIQGIIGKLIFDAERLAETAEDLIKQARGMAEGSNAQRQAAGDLDRILQQMAEGVNATAGHAQRTAANAQEARRLSQQGRQAVSSASAEIERIAQAMEGSLKVITALGDRSQAIGGIVQVIREIADQTNLLALNAAIEAARAGEQGRGFAVVADEVRNLAMRTSAATNEISHMIAAIQEETRSAVQVIRSIADQSQLGVELARQANESLERIDQGAQETMEQVEKMAQAIAEQGRETKRVAQQVREILSLAGDTAKGADQTFKAAQTLESLAINLHEISNVFRLGEPGRQAIAQHQRMTALVPRAASEIGRQLEQL
ncbi:MAG: methyl-accepting chemotaxis protein, partial [Azovibrio sp.]|nr:methyl-accepting chemotaxis protein [Azovibrio sp.]